MERRIPARCHFPVGRCLAPQHPPGADPRPPHPANRTIIHLPLQGPRRRRRTPSLRRPEPSQICRPARIPVIEAILVMEAILGWIVIRVPIPALRGVARQASLATRVADIARGRGRRVPVARWRAAVGLAAVPHHLLVRPRLRVSEAQPRAWGNRLRRDQPPAWGAQPQGAQARAHITPTTTRYVIAPGRALTSVVAELSVVDRPAQPVFSASTASV